MEQLMIVTQDLKREDKIHLLYRIDSFFTKCWNFPKIPNSERINFIQHSFDKKESASNFRKVKISAKSKMHTLPNKLIKIHGTFLINI